MIIPSIYRDSDLTIRRFDLPLNQPLVLGPGLNIHSIPYYFTKIEPGGEGWSVSSPLWGGFRDRPLNQGIADVQRLIVEATRYVWERYIVGRKKGSLDLREIQHHIRGVPDYLWTNMRVPSLIKGMAFAPLMGALADSEARAVNESIAMYLSNIFRNNSPFFFEVDRRQVLPALTIGGDATGERVAELQKQYGQREFVKFKIGTKKGGVEAEAEFIQDVLAQYLLNNPYFILDANQAFSSQDCGELLGKLASAGHLEKLLFLEQPSKVGDEPSDFDTMYDAISPGIKLSWDESVASAADVKRLAERISGRSAPHVLVVPKFEKLGLVEFVEMYTAAKEYGFGVTPSTLTGPPNQWALFANLVERLPCFTFPDNPRIIPVEANGYEILKWGEIVEALSVQSTDEIFSKQPLKSVNINRLEEIFPEGIPREARTGGLDKMVHSLVVSGKDF